MSVQLASLSWTGNKTAHRPNKVVLPLSNGNEAYVVTVDDDNLRIFKVNSTTNAVSNFLNTSIGTPDYPAHSLSADVYSNNDIAVVIRKSTGVIEFRRVTAAGSIGAAETVQNTNISNQVTSADITVTDGDIPVVCWTISTDSNPKLVLNTKARTSAGAWVAAPDINLMAGSDPNNVMSNISVQAVKGGSATSRPIMVAADSAQANGSDLGCRIYSFVLNESTGAIVNQTLRKTYLAGDQAVTFSAQPRKSYLFPSATNEIVLGRIETGDPKNMAVARMTFDGNTFAEAMPLQTMKVPAGNILPMYGGACSFGGDAVTFFFGQEIGGRVNLVSYVGKLDRANNKVNFSGKYNFDDLEGSPQARQNPMAGTGRYSNVTPRPHVAFLGIGTGGAYNIRYQSVKPAPAPTDVAPGTGTTITGTPSLGLRIKLNRAFGQVRYKAEWQFANDAAFTSNLKVYVQDDSKLINVDNTAAAGSYVAIADTWPSSQTLPSGNWFVRARVVDEYGQVGAWSGTTSTSYSHPPAATNLNPSAGKVLPDTAVTFSWKFTDPLPTDTQSAFQVLVQRNDTGATVYDSGKITTTSESHLTNLSSSLQGVLLQWSVRLWDSDDQAGAYSALETFSVAGPPVVTVASPTPAGTLASGTPGITFSATVTGDRTIKAYQVTISQSGKVVKNSGSVAGSWASGEQILWRSPMPLLDDGTYQVNVTVMDSTGMTDTEGPITFSIATVPPASAFGTNADATNYGIEEMGYISVTWSHTNRDPNYEAYVISRKSDMLSYGTTVSEEGEWEQIGIVYGESAEYEYKDYTAPSGYKVNYRVAQLVNRNGDRAISQSNTVKTVYPVSDGYWIITPIDDSGTTSAFRLHNVTSDSFTDEYEENEYVVIGRGRKNDRGDHLGVKGSLSAQLRDTLMSTSRQKLKALQDARAIESALYLRNAFGDVYYVNLGNIGVTRIAGVGRQEFVDVEIPYSEVVE